MEKYLNRACALIAVFVVQGIVAATALAVEEPASLVFRIPDITVQSDGVHPVMGMLDVSLDLTGHYALNPPTIASYNVALELLDQPTGVALGLPLDMVDNKLFEAGNTYAGATDLPHTIRFAKDAVSPVAASDGGVMVRIPFMVDAGRSGTFPLRFIAGNEMTNPSAEALALELAHGSITVLPAAALVGDYNGDGLVDAADFVVWRNSFGQTGTDLPADGNANGSIDNGDYDLWRAGFGHVSPAEAAAATIPEPATILSAVVVGFTLLFVRIGRR
jgi:hypothetical protein